VSLMLRAAALAATLFGLGAGSSHAALIADCGLNPNACIIDSGPAGSASGPFVFDWTFQLSNAASLAVAITQSAESGQAVRYITDWTLAIYAAPPPGPGGGLAGGPIAATTFIGLPPLNFAQLLDLSATLSAGFYFLEYTGIGGSAASFNGQFSTSSTTGGQGVPGPMAGAGIPGLILMFGGAAAWWRLRQRLGIDLVTAS